MYKRNREVTTFGVVAPPGLAEMPCVVLFTIYHAASTPLPRAPVQEMGGNRSSRVESPVIQVYAYIDRTYGRYIENNALGRVPNTHERCGDQHKTDAIQLDKIRRTGVNHVRTPAVYHVR